MSQPLGLVIGTQLGQRMAIGWPLDPIRIVSPSESSLDLLLFGVAW
jgi:hypothetical protein